MDCKKAQELLLSAERIDQLLDSDPTLASHIQTCPDCKSLIRQLTTLDSLAASLPVPKAKLTPSPAFLEKVRNLPPAPITFRSWRARFIRRAVAAAIVLVVGLSAIMLFLQSENIARADTLLRDLVSWNLQLAHAAPSDRSTLFTSRVSGFMASLAKTNLSSAQQTATQALLDNAKFLSTSSDPLSDAEHLQSTAQELTTARSSTTDASASQTLSDMAKTLVTQGVLPAVQHVNPATLTPTQQQEYQSLQQQLGTPQTSPAHINTTTSLTPAKRVINNVTASTFSTTTSTITPLVVRGTDVSTSSMPTAPITTAVSVSTTPPPSTPVQSPATTITHAPPHTQPPGRIINPGEFTTISTDAPTKSASAADMGSVRNNWPPMPTVNPGSIASAKGSPSPSTGTLAESIPDVPYDAAGQEASDLPLLCVAASDGQELTVDDLLPQFATETAPTGDRIRMMVAGIGSPHAIRPMELPEGFEFPQSGDMTTRWNPSQMIGEASLFLSQPVPIGVPEPASLVVFAGTFLLISRRRR